jgi:predicted lipoprotein
MSLPIRCSPQWSRRNLMAALVLLCGAPALTSCGPKPVPDRRRELLRSWGTHFLQARLREFSNRLEQLAAASGSLEEVVDQERLEQAQQAWWAARRPWKEIEVFKFGPSEEEPLRYGPKIDFWPARPSEVEAVLADTGSIDPSSFGAAAKGLPAVEYLLYSEGALEQFADNPRRHEYLQILVEDLIKNAAGLSEAWDPDAGDYLSQLVDAGAGSESYQTLSMALSELVNRMAFTIENIRADKLAAGISSDGTPQPERLESHFSGRSVTDVLDNLRGIHTLYFGEQSGDVLALDDYLQHRGYQLGSRVRAAFRRSREAVEQLDQPLSDAVREDPAGVESAIAELGQLQRLIQVDVIGALSLSVRFNDNDGD